jgi:hypothetical protein
MFTEQPPMTASLPKGFTALVVVLAILSIALLPMDGLANGILELSILAILAMVVGSRSVRLPGTGLTITASDVFTLVAFSGPAPMGAPLVAALGTLGGEFLSQRPRTVVRMIFNAAAVPLSMSIAVWARMGVLSLTGENPSATTITYFLGAVLYLLVNLVLVAIVVGLERRRSVVATMANAGPWTFISVLASGIVALGLMQLSHSLGSPSLMLGLTLVPPFTAYFKSHAAAPATAPVAETAKPLDSRTAASLI